ncbi:hypothetical protein HCN44_000031 [Aphidius gifuensis]|uniref:Calcitonin receptor n=1 Tax=Aphidius gifuensis TaxID=684658 RepID=A0A834XSY3_APHGI|nr:hypothetical protein HCN44_000031 [Aphidius gifuensis]
MMPNNLSTTVGSTLQDDEFRRVVEERRQECLEQLAINTTVPAGLYCRSTFDGWSCWPNTLAGEKAYAPCPSFITGFDESRFAHKFCEADGTWFKHPLSNIVWSNYTTCIDMVDLGWQQKLNVVFEIGYLISLIALLLSLAILTYFRSLRCARITIHMNLFASFAINNALWLLWYIFLANPGLLMENGIFCRSLHVILQYFLLTNYAWMLCEGFYLHTILVNAFTSEHKLVKWLMALGWPTPAIIVTIYTILRATSDDPKDLSQCWIDESNYINVLIYPVCVSTLLNLAFLCNIVRVLLTKLRAGPAIGSRPSRSMLQALRATLLLVPLLGLHYLVIPFRPPKGHPYAETYDVISAITISFQGFCVAMLFCFCNGEVIAQFKRKWEGSAFIRKRQNSCTATTVSVRWRERRRCDYQLELPTIQKDGILVENHNSPIVISTRNDSNRIKNSRGLIKRNDSAYDVNQYQTQC